MVITAAVMRYTSYSLRKERGFHKLLLILLLLDVKELLMSLQQARMDVLEELKEADLWSIIPAIESVFQSQTAPFESLRNKYQQENDRKCVSITLCVFTVLVYNN